MRAQSEKVKWEIMLCALQCCPMKTVNLTAGYCEGGKINIHMKTVNTVWNIELSIGLDHINLEVLAGYIVFTRVVGNTRKVLVSARQHREQVQKVRR